ncbi:glycosyltransferase [Dyadobacter sp. SG02]|uniref:glycosyltransferase n=1 Tax=Dyadobacter sp. SG02 TaxID=1855291 RepID=UPI000B8375B9|nr:glycosyltransferase [Dyadobacter sp. SG02]
MKIIHVVSGMDPRAGGISQAVRTMIRGLDGLGVVSEVVSTGLPSSTANDSFNTHFTGPGKTSWQFSLALSNWLRQNITRYDAVLVHGLWQHHTYAVYHALARIPGVRPRLFVMPHGMLDPWFQKAKGRKIKAIRNWLIWHVFEQRVIHMADGLLFTCETEKQLARTTFRPYRPKSERVVGLGVDAPPTYDREMNRAFAKRSTAANRRYLLFLGRIDVKKGVDLLLTAYLDLKTRRDDLPALVIAGPGMDTPFGVHLRKLARADPDVTFPGMLSGNAKWGAFYGCEAFVLPSHQENFGIAVVEALACGKPVLISDQVNIWQQIEDHGGGLIAKDTAEGIREMLLEWLSLAGANKALLSFQARTIYREHYAVPQAAEKLYRALVQPEIPVLT